ncbi:MAG: hypothetical protein M0Z95_02420 [Actinomycetota bacterium]|nr:hypothetical protein [Actinomycetota bacterium]
MRPKTAPVAIDLLSQSKARATDLVSLELADAVGDDKRTVVVAVYDKLDQGAYLETVPPLDRPFDGLVDGATAGSRIGSAVVFTDVQVGDEGAPVQPICHIVVAERRGQSVELFYGTGDGPATRHEIADLPTPAARRFGALAELRAGGVVDTPPVLLAGEVLGALWCFSVLSFVQVLGTPLGVDVVLASDPLKFVDPREPGRAWEAIARHIEISAAPILIAGVDIRPFVEWMGDGGLGWVLLGQQPRTAELRAMLRQALDDEARACLASALRSRSWWPGR